MQLYPMANGRWWCQRQNVYFSQKYFSDSLEENSLVEFHSAINTFIIGLKPNFCGFTRKKLNKQILWISKNIPRLPFVCFEEKQSQIHQSNQWKTLQSKCDLMIFTNFCFQWFFLYLFRIRYSISFRTIVFKNWRKKKSTIYPFYETKNNLKYSFSVTAKWQTQTHRWGANWALNTV